MPPHFAGVAGGPATLVGELGDSSGGEKRRDGLPLQTRGGNGGEEALPTGMYHIPVHILRM